MSQDVTLQFFFFVTSTAMSSKYTFPFFVPKKLPLIVIASPILLSERGSTVSITGFVTVKAPVMKMGSGGLTLGLIDYIIYPCRNSLA